MAVQLRHLFNEQVVRAIANDLSRVRASFLDPRFVEACMTGLADLAAEPLPKLLTPRIDLPGDMGAFFHIRDSEGNRVGLHAQR